MKDKGTTNKVKRRKLRITQEDVIRVINGIIAREGMEKAIEALKLMNDLFCGEDGWIETAKEVQALIASRRKLEQQTEQQQRVDMARALASGGINMQNSQCQFFTGGVTGSTFNQGE